MYGTDLMQRRTWEWGIRRYWIKRDDSRVIALSLGGVEWVILAYSLATIFLLPFEHLILHLSIAKGNVMHKILCITWFTLYTSVQTEAKMSVLYVVPRTQYTHIVLFNTYLHGSGLAI